jgi:WD40 repeat protein
MNRAETCTEDVRDDLRAVLDEELVRLPEKYRAPLVLCYLQEQGHAEAARALGWPTGSMSMRLARGRELLRRRLERRGVTLAASGALTAAVPAALAQATVRSAVLFTGRTASGPTAALATGMLQSMLITRVQAMAAAVLLLGAVVGGSLLAYQACSARQGEEEPGTEAAQADDGKPSDAPAVRTDRYGDPLPNGAVARLGAVRWRHPRMARALVFSPDDKILASVCWDTAILWDAATGKELRRLPTAPLGRFGGPDFTPDGKSLVLQEKSGDVSFWDVATGKLHRRFPGTREVDPVLRVSPDGKVLAVSADYGAVNLLDATNGQVLHQLGGKGPPPVYSLAFSPDGKLIVLGPSLQLWDVDTGRLVRAIEKAENLFLYASAFSPDGKVHASGGDDFILLSDVATGKEIGRLLKMARSWMLDFTPDGKTLVSAGSDGKVRIWDLETKKERFTLDSGCLGGMGMALSHDGKTVALGTQSCVIHLWAVDTGKELFTQFQGHGAPIGSLAFTEDGKALVTADYNAQARKWDLASGKQLWELQRSGFGRVLAPDANRFVTQGDFENTMRVWDFHTGVEVCRMKQSNRGWIRGLEFSRDGKELVSFSWNIPDLPPDHRDARLTVWEARTGSQIREFSLPGLDLEKLIGVLTHRPLVLTPDGRTAIVSDGEGVIRLYDLEDGKHILSLGGHKMYAGAFVLSVDGKTLISGGLDSTVRVWDLLAGRQVAVLQGHKRAIAALALSPDGRLAASAGGVPCLSDRGVPIHPYDDVTEPRRIRLWDVATGKDVAHFEGHQDDVTALAFSPDGRRLVSGLRDGTVLVWDVTALPRLPALEGRADELDGLWEDLAGSDAFNAHQAIWKLAATPDKAVPFLNEHVPPAAEVDAKRVRRWIADLDSDQFTVRTAAVKELEKLGDRAAPALRAALAGQPSAEVRKQADELLAGLRLVRSPEVLQRLRAVQVLERIGSPEARRVLEALAKGAPDARETREAQASLDRRPTP